MTLRSSTIVPFCVHVPSQTVYIVLAQIARTQSGRSAAWGDLGGVPGNNESSESTAAREFYEESLGVFGELKMEENLMTGQYLIKCTFQYDDGSHSDYYVVEVPFDRMMAKRFRTIREELLLLPEGFNVEFLPDYLRDKISGGNVGDEFFEKQALDWFSLDHLMDILSESSTIIRPSFSQPLSYIVSELLDLLYVPDT